MIYAATGEEGIGNGYLPRDAGASTGRISSRIGGLYAYAQMHATDAGTVLKLMINNAYDNRAKQDYDMTRPMRERNHNL